MVVRPNRGAGALRPIMRPLLCVEAAAQWCGRERGGPHPGLRLVQWRDGEAGRLRCPRGCAWASSRELAPCRRRQRSGVVPASGWARSGDPRKALGLRSDRGSCRTPVWCPRSPPRGPCNRDAHLGRRLWRGLQALTSPSHESRYPGPGVLSIAAGVGRAGQAVRPRPCRCSLTGHPVAALTGAGCQTRCPPPASAAPDAETVARDPGSLLAPRSWARGCPPRLCAAALCREQPVAAPASSGMPARSAGPRSGGGYRAEASMDPTAPAFAEVSRACRQQETGALVDGARPVWPRASEAGPRGRPVSALWP